MLKAKLSAKTGRLCDLAGLEAVRGSSNCPAAISAGRCWRSAMLARSNAVTRQCWHSAIASC